MVAELQESITSSPDWPPVMPWREFADWCRAEQGVVQGWIERGYLPTIKFGQHRMVNVAALIDQLKEGEV